MYYWKLTPAPSILSGSLHLITSLREQPARRVTHACHAHWFLLPRENTVHKSCLQKGVCLGYGSRGRVPDSRSSMPAGGWSRKPKDHITARRKQRAGSGAAL